MDPHSEAYMGLGYLYLKEGKNDLAEASFKDFIVKLRPKDDVYMGLGSLYMKERRYDEAIDVYTKAAELKPDLGGYLELARAYVAKSEYAAARKALNRELAVHPDSVSAKELMRQIANK